MKMKPLAVIGVLLIVFGIGGLILENVSFTEQKTVLDAGPLKITKDETKTIPIPTIAGVVAIIAGLGLVVMSRRRV
jgi:hypothetical protein